MNFYVDFSYTAVTETNAAIDAAIEAGGGRGGILHKKVGVRRTAIFGAREAAETFVEKLKTIPEVYSINNLRFR